MLKYKQTRMKFLVVGKNDMSDMFLSELEPATYWTHVKQASHKPTLLGIEWVMSDKK